MSAFGGKADIRLLPITVFIEVCQYNDIKSIRCGFVLLRNLMYSIAYITTTEPIVPSQPLRRVVSLIASATEIVSALGRNDWLVGRSHECDFPPEVARLPALTAPKFKVEGTSTEIDARVQQIVRDGLSVYRVDGDALKALDPDIIVTHPPRQVWGASVAHVDAETC